MKTQVTFRSDAFPPYDGEEEEINPGLWGKRLAEYLVEKLGERGIGTDGYVTEDWGCYLPVTVNGTRLAVCCGHQNGDDDEFLCFTEPATPVVRKLFRKVDLTEPLGRLVAVLDEILTADPGIREVAWEESGR